MTTMNIFLIRCNSKFGTWDSYDGHVIIAKTREEVITLAQRTSGTEGKKAWSDESVTIEILGPYIGKDTESDIILSSYNAG